MRVNLLGIPAKQAGVFSNSGSVAMVRLAQPWLYQFSRDQKMVSLGF